MPGTRTAAQLVRMVREHTQEMSKGTYRDGFTTDTGTDGVAAPSTSAISLLSFLNQALGVMASAGFVTQNFVLTLLNGQYEYALPPACGKIIYVQCVNNTWACDLSSVTYDDVRRRGGPDWRRRAAGTPKLFFTLGQFINVFPAPVVAAGTNTLTIRAHDVPPDLVASTDTPSTLPIRWHNALALLAALLLVNSDADNPAQTTRREALLSLWDLQDKELQDLIDARSVLDRRAREGG